MARIWPFRIRQEAPKSVAAREVQVEDDEQRYKPIEWPLVKRVLKNLLPYKGLYGLGAALGMLMLLLDMQSPRFMQQVIDHVSAFAGGKLPGMSPRQACWRVVSIVLIWAGVAAVARVLERYVILIMTYAGEKVQFSLRRRLFEHLQRLSMSYYDKTKLGRIISRCTSDIAALREVNVWGIWQVVANLLMMLFAAAMLVWTDWRLFLAVAWLGPVLYLSHHIYRKKSTFMFQVAREGYTRVSTNLAENITGMRVVVAFNRQTPNLSRFNALQVTNTENNMNTARITGLYQPTLELIRFLGRVIIIVYGAYLLVRGEIGASEAVGIGSVVAAYLYWDWFMNPIINFGNFSTQLMMAMAGAERVFALLDMPPEVQDEPSATPLPRIAGHVRFEHVTFGYNPERPVLHDIDFQAAPGQMVALVGATGSGKSSIISLIARFYQPQAGRILVDDHDIRFVQGETLNRQTGLVLQVNYLFSGTVMENIRYGRLGAGDEDVIAAARAIGSYDAIMSLQDGFATEVGERGASMSLGQRQLICFTRAFLADPRIFMLDEATSAVDTGTEMLIQRSLEKLLEGRTTFIVAHRLSTILRADMILVIDQGRIVERGTHGELVDAGGKYAHLYEQFVSHT
ncbi:MAG TPA: ABC transporter ATP-binding protein [Tepidisphaeraceae bacterium]|jgi:ATP-binding cassette subfamily B protein